MTPAEEAESTNAKVARQRRFVNQTLTWLACVGALATVVLLFQLAHVDALGDTFWYLALGRWYFEHGSFPAQDPFSFTAGSIPYTPRMPAAYLLFAGLERLAGLRSVLVLCALVETAALLWAWLARSRAQGRWLLFPLVACVCFQGREDLCARGQIFGDLCFVWFVTQLPRIVESAPKRRLEYLLFPVMGAVWANLHPSVLLVFVLGGLYLVVAWFSGEVGAVGLRRGAVVVALLLVGSVLTPSGAGLLFEAALLLVAPSTRSLDLFRSPDFQSPAVLMILAAAGTTFVVGFRRRRLAFGELSWLLLLFFAACSGRRYLTLLGLLTLVLGGRVLDASRFGSSAVGATNCASRSLQAKWSVAISVVAALAFLASAVPVFKPVLRHMPVEGAAYVAKHNLPDRVFAPYHWGGYLDYAWAGKRRVFYDGRNFLFDSSGVFADGHRIEAVAVDAGALLFEYQINTVLCERGSALDEALRPHPEWQERKRATLSVVYVRVRPLRVESP